jgi:hypothetical protein
VQRDGESAAEAFQLGSFQLSLVRSGDVNFQRESSTPQVGH